MPEGNVSFYLSGLDSGSVCATTARIEKLSPREALLELVQHTYVNWVVSREQRANEFDTLFRLVQQVPVRRIVPHAEPKKLLGLCDLILQGASAVLISPKSL